MKYLVFLKASAAVVSLAVLATNVPTQSYAEQYDMCRLETVPDNIKRKISRRSDFKNVLQLMFENCPESALALTEAATASIGQESSDDGERKGEPSSDSGRSRSSSSDDPSSNGPDDNGPDGDSPDGGGPEGDGPEGDGPEGDGPEGDGPLPS